MNQYVAAIDHGTTSTRCMLFDHGGDPVASSAREHRQILPRAGWVEHDPLEIWSNTRAVIDQAMEQAEVSAGDVVAVGIANQRETALVWDRRTGEPVHNAIVWQDTRTQGIVAELGHRGGGANRYRSATGLPLSTYFAAPKARWILDNVTGARGRADGLLFGTMDSWLLWNLTGGVDGGVHATDVTNASRTLLMNLDTLQWDPDLADELGVPMSMLPTIRSCSERFGTVRGTALDGTAVTGILGDQHAATFGQVCFDKGSAKNTYGTGNFMLLNTGTDRINSDHGLITTVCYQLGDQPPVYALEGSIAVTGSLVQWLRDNLGIISSADEIEDLAGQVDDNGGAYFVPAFSGLFAPYWRADARGALVGLTRFVDRRHLCRAVLEATAFQTREVLEAMDADAGVVLTELKVDGGMVANDLLMQFQADLLDVPVIRPRVPETTALGAAYAAGLATGYWSGLDELTANWSEDRRWRPEMPAQERERTYRNWKKAVQRSLGWVDEDV